LGGLLQWSDLVIVVLTIVPYNEAIGSCERSQYRHDSKSYKEKNEFCKSI